MSVPTIPLDSTNAEILGHSALTVVFEDVWLAFADTEVLCGVSFRLAVGETKALFGVAGSGKSTILKLVLGLLKTIRNVSFCSNVLSPLTVAVIVLLVSPGRKVSV